MKIDREFVLFFILIALSVSIGFSRERVLFYVGEEVTPPKAVSTPSPPLTDEAKKVGENALILHLEAVVTATGSVRDIKILEGLKYGLNESTIDMLTKHWLFEPATYQGQPVEAKMDVLIVFRLDDAASPREPIDVDRLRFVGNAVFTEDQLRSIVQEKLKALGSVQTDQIRIYYIDEAIRELYQAQGYIEIHDRWLPDNVLQIQEGKQFRIGRLEIRKATVFPVDHLLALLGLKNGDVADYPRIRAGVEKIRQWYVSAGVPNWSYIVEQTVREDAGELDLTYVFEESLNQ